MRIEALLPPWYEDEIVREGSLVDKVGEGSGAAGGERALGTMECCGKLGNWGGGIGKEGEKIGDEGEN